jgi:CheY-like chemotaxis protein
LEPNLGPVVGDQGQIEQVLMNLVLNARDSMPQGGKITIETANLELDETYTRMHPDLKPGHYTLLAVTDTGCGMNDEVKAHIFEPFFTTKEMNKGTGLGLAMVYGIVKQCQGHISLYSEPNQGTTFRIYLPRISKKRSLPGISLTDQEPHGNETILVVEDGDAVRDITRQMLTLLGYRVLEASRGEQAIRLVEQNAEHIHLLVTDVVMPQMGGRQLAERLLLLRPDLKILYFSGYMDDAIVRHGILQAEVAFLHKPFALGMLARKVREVLDAKPASK